MMKQKYFIDSNKAATAIVIITLMAIYDQWSNTTAWVYLAMHGTYGILWIIKSIVFPDKKWERTTSLWFGILIWGGLSLYWIAPWMIVSHGVEAPNWYLSGCIFIYIVGVFLHFSSDMQKFISLKLRPNNLITDGLWGSVRNPNYLGELLIYGGFGLLTIHLVPLGILLMWILVIWIPYMRRKDESLSRYPGFEVYKSKTKLFLPYIF
jgi:steroid 5-alpha reductase family enzyme